ncbi:pilus assembly protein Flp/PilA [Oceanisphaera litoralis]|uniref:pilus assembly protein n=1 Tax=Oceanisphaera litoralis TaxID=225144 RepID=UPI00195CA8C4|nr:pilus assembly protein [Oceanisphaera litoralis]MBM7454249.1 pilus assembly protein Flp/PilA [Oceanisphaera litoralis]
MKLLTELNRLLQDEEGLTMVEYAVAGALVAAGAAGAFVTLGGNVESRITCLSEIVGETTSSSLSTGGKDKC